MSRPWHEGRWVHTAKPHTVPQAGLLANSLVRFSELKICAGKQAPYTYPSKLIQICWESEDQWPQGLFQTDSFVKSLIDISSITLVTASFPIWSLHFTFPTPWCSLQEARALNIYWIYTQQCTNFMKNPHCTCSAWHSYPPTWCTHSTWASSSGSPRGHLQQHSEFPLPRPGPLGTFPEAGSILTDRWPCLPSPPESSAPSFDLLHWEHSLPFWETRNQRTGCQL